MVANISSRKFSIYCRLKHFVRIQHFLNVSQHFSYINISYDSLTFYATNILTHQHYP
jgi:hypothetical protein